MEEIHHLQATNTRSKDTFDKEVIFTATKLNNSDYTKEKNQMSKTFENLKISKRSL